MWLIVIIVVIVVIVFFSTASSKKNTTYSSVGSTHLIKTPNAKEFYDKSLAKYDHKDFDKAIEIDPNLTTAFLNKSLAQADSDENYEPIKYNKRSIEEIKKLAEQGNSEYQNQLGNAYLLGEGVPRNLVIAVDWYKKAADQNNFDAQRSLAYAYKDADGVEQDIEESMFWFEKAAKQGDANSQMMIGSAYNLGIGVQKNKEKASFYLKAAAKQNEKTAIYLLSLFPELNI